MNNEFLLMSIKTKHAKKIFSGEKTFEYRTKSINQKNLNKYCLIYSSEEQRSVIGYVVFDYIVEGDCDYLIKNTEPEDVNLLKHYFGSKEKCFALHIKEYEEFDNPITINELKKYDAKFNIPQYYRYVKKDEYLYSIIYNKTRTHSMNLTHEFFDYIKNGHKRIEVRLLDDKRKQIKIADKVIFTDLDYNNKLETRVKNLYLYKNFSSLIDDFNIELLTDNKYDKSSFISILNQFYSNDKQRLYGVVGIEVEIDENV